MLRISAFLMALAIALHAQLLPEQAGAYQRHGKAAAQAVDQPALWNEFGLEANERVEYRAPDVTPLTVTAFRFIDATGAFAAWQWRRQLEDRSKLKQFHNYLVRFHPELPSTEVQTAIAGKLQQVRRQAEPTLPGFLPEEDRIAGSEVYVLGPVALRTFEPRLNPEIAGFHLASEAQLAQYRIDGQPVTLALFNYPTPQMAVQRARAFSAQPELAVSRSGPLVAVVVGAPGGSEAARQLASSVRWEHRVVQHERRPDEPRDVAELLLAIGALAGGLILASLAFGFFFGGTRSVLRWFGKTPEEEFTGLNLTTGK
jgi:hypothetical protein